MKAVIHKTGAIVDVLGIERRDDGIDYVYFENGLCKPVSEVGFLNPYEQYMEDCDDWSSFRREAAKDILAGMLSNPEKISIRGERLATIDGFVNAAIEITDELIRQIKEK